MSRCPSEIVDFGLCSFGSKDISRIIPIGISVFTLHLEPWNPWRRWSSTRWSAKWMSLFLKKLRTWLVWPICAWWCNSLLCQLFLLWQGHTQLPSSARLEERILKRWFEVVLCRPCYKQCVAWFALRCQIWRAVARKSTAPFAWQSEPMMRLH